MADSEHFFSQRGLDLLPIFTWLRRQKSTTSAAKSPATQAKESVSLLSLLRADPFPVSSLFKSPLCQSSAPSKVINLVRTVSRFS